MSDFEDLESYKRPVLELHQIECRRNGKKQVVLKDL